MHLTCKNAVKTVFGFLLAFCLAFSAKASPNDSLVNRNAARVVFQQVLGKKLKPDFYNGKILVLDFWATWCAPCIAGFPHFNEFADRYADKGVVFASITSEPLTRVQKFFTRTKKELKALKLIDTTGATLKTYHVMTPPLEKMVGIPYCVIIDQHNIVRWVGQTDQLTTAILDQVIQHGAVDLPAKHIARSPRPVNKPIASRALFSFNVALADSTKIRYEGDGESEWTYKTNITGMTGAGLPLDDVIQTISGYSKTRFVTNNDQKLKQLIDIDFRFGNDTTRFAGYADQVLKGSPVKNFGISLLGEALKFRAKIVTKKQHHYELVVADSAKWHSFKSLSTHKSYDFDQYPTMVIIGFPIDQIASFVESNAKIMITTHVKDKDQHDVSLDVSNLQALNESLGFHGLKLVETDDDVSVLQIDFY